MKDHIQGKTKSRWNIQSGGPVDARDIAMTIGLTKKRKYGSGQRRQQKFVSGGISEEKKWKKGIG